MACLNRALRNTWKVLSLMNFDTTELQEECSMDDNYFVKVWWKNQEFLGNYAAPSAVGLPAMYGVTTGAHLLWEWGSNAAAGAASVGGGGGVAITDHSDHAPLESIFSRGVGMLTAERDSLISRAPR